MNKTLRDMLKGIRAGDVLGFLGVALSLIALFRDKSLQNDATVWVFGTYIFTLAALLVWREFVYSRKARYAEASNSMHKCAHALRDAHGAVDRKNLEQVHEKVRDALVSFADAFSLITGANCRACIKTITAATDSKGNDQTIFCTETLARSCTSERTDADEPAPINDNTDFKVLFERQQTYFASDDLSGELAYMNSHWPSNPDKRKEFIRLRKYKYVTTVVWPIRSPAPTVKEMPQVIGYLCVDSLTRGIFERRYDIDLGAVIADTLYPLLLRYRNTAEFHVPHAA